MIGILDVGGGLRAAYGTGVLDACLEKGIRFDYCIGVSAGAANMCSYVAGQKGRNLPFYRDYCQRPEYMGLHTLLHTGSVLDLNYIYSTLSNEGGENPLDYDALQASPTILKIVATDAETGKPVYFDKSEIERNDYGILKASCCLPVVCRPALWKGRAYYDGGVSDGVPFRRAFADGCDRLVVILTRPESWRMEPRNRDERLTRLVSARYPAIHRVMKKRASYYNHTVAVLEQYAAQGRVWIVAPDDCCGVDTLTKNPENIEQLYEKGRTDADGVARFFEKAAAAAV